MPRSDMVFLIHCFSYKSVFESLWFWIFILGFRCISFSLFNEHFPFSLASCDTPGCLFEFFLCSSFLFLLTLFWSFVLHVAFNSFASVLSIPCFLFLISLLLAAPFPSPCLLLAQCKLPMHLHCASFPRSSKLLFAPASHTSSLTHTHFKKLLRSSVF